MGAGHPPIRRNLVKTNWAVNSERQDKEDDVVDNPGGKLEQLDEKEATKNPLKRSCESKNQFPTKFFIKITIKKSKHEEAKEDDDTGSALQRRKYHPNCALQNPEDGRQFKKTLVSALTGSCRIKSKVRSSTSPLDSYQVQLYQDPNFLRYFLSKSTRRAKNSAFLTTKNIPKRLHKSHHRVIDESCSLKLSSEGSSKL